MGTGKNAVGKLLADQLDMDIADTDFLIEQKEVRAIVEIFQSEGEGYFRKVEKEVIREVSSYDNTVIIAGGGVVLDEENIESLKKNAILVCLKATAEVILERTKGYKHRPLLNTEDPKTKIEELLDKRAPYYAKADFDIDTSNLKPFEVAERIIKIWKKKSV